MSSHCEKGSPAASVPVIQVQPISTSSGRKSLRRVTETPSGPYEARETGRSPAESRTLIPIDGWADVGGERGKEGRGRRRWAGVGA